MKKNIIVLASSVFAAAVLAADVPQVSKITATQSIASREVTVS